MNKQFKAWITKYALTRGILEMTVEQSDDLPSCVHVLRRFSWSFYGEGREWHRTRKSAEKRAKQMLCNKIMALSRQIDKLKKMTFTDEESK